MAKKHGKMVLLLQDQDLLEKILLHNYNKGAFYEYAIFDQTPIIFSE